MSLPANHILLQVIAAPIATSLISFNSSREHMSRIPILNLLVNRRSISRDAAKIEQTRLLLALDIGANNPRPNILRTLSHHK